MFGKEGTKKVDTTCRFKGKSLLGVKEKKKRDGGRKQSFAVVIH
jgi:hypothetical protein